jgi:hypothetical protein
MSREAGLINATTEWGYWRGKVWMALPKTPMTLAGFGPPPFKVVRPDGREITVEARTPTVPAA